jgi:hypothetical protein
MKKIALIILALTLFLGTVIVALPPVKATDGVRFYIKNLSNDTNIYPGATPPPPFPPPAANVKVQVLIESPISWMGTPDGIISYMVSVRVDPRALTVKSIMAPTADLQGDTFADDFLAMYAAYLVYMGYDVTTISGPPALSATTGTMYGFAYALAGASWDPSLGGAGGNVYDGSDIALIAELQFVSKSATIPSLIDLMGPGVNTAQIVNGLEVECKYTNARGETFTVEPEDGYYVDEVDTRFFDSSAGYDPAASPMGTDWHELATTYGQSWTLDGWTDTNADGKLTATDQIGMTQTSGNTPGASIGGLADWVNTAPVAGDGLADLIITVIPVVPEFPLGIGVLMSLVALVPIVYVWRTRPKKKVE